MQPSSLKTVCSHCYCESAGVLEYQCESCLYAHFCSHECLEDSRGSHGLVCKVHRDVIVAAGAQKVSGSTAMLMLCAGLLCSIETLPEEEDLNARALDGVPRSNIEAFMRLQANTDKLEDEDLEVYKADAALLRSICSVAAAYTVERLTDFFSRVACNCFRIENAELDLLGLALYPGASFFNHSCAPNVVYIFDGKCMVFRALRDLRPGEEVCISYIRLVGGKERRRSRLLSHYYFDCVCEACLSEPDHTKLSGFVCTSDECRGKRHPLKPLNPPEPLVPAAPGPDGLICPPPPALVVSPEPKVLGCGHCGAHVYAATLRRSREVAKQLYKRFNKAVRKLARLRGVNDDDDDEEEEEEEEEEDEDDDEEGEGAKEKQGGLLDGEGALDTTNEEGGDNDNAEEDDEATGRAIAAAKKKVERVYQRAQDTFELLGILPVHTIAYELNEDARAHFQATEGIFHRLHVESLRRVVEHLSSTIPEHECELAIEREQLAKSIMGRLVHNYQEEVLNPAQDEREARDLIKKAYISTKITYGDDHPSTYRLRNTLARAIQIAK